jgi:VWFA-related protein
LSDHFLHALFTFLALAALSGFAIAAADREEAQPTPDPFEVDYIEETGVELMLLDVEVYDEQGRPSRGLTKEDFTLTINGRVKQIYSLDDLCPCSAQPEVAAGGSVSSAGPAEQALPAVSEPMTYVLYINFGQLQQDGRVHALDEARRWIRETMQPGDRVQVLAWSAQAGLKRLTPIVESKAKLLAAIDKADRSAELVDPLPALRSIRQEEVRECWNKCKSRSVISQGSCTDCEIMATDYAKEEYYHGKWSMSALQQALYALEREPGRKSLLYFYQNDTMMPARLFLGVNQKHVMDHVRTLDRTAAEANLSRTSITAAYSGSDPSPEAISVGANLADYTGGSYSRAAHLTPAVTAEAGRGCRCLYRIAVRPPARRRESVYNASVWVRDQQVPRRFRLQHLSRFDRWLREAQAALAAPELMGDLPVTISLTPLANERGRWQVVARIVVSVDALLLLPAAGGKHGSWETGALLFAEQSGGPMEFLARSRMSTESEDTSGSYVVHERTVEGLQPGPWSMGAFVRDRNTNLFGGAQGRILLPKPGKAGISTPVLMQAGRSWLRTELPPLRKKNQEPVKTGAVVEDPLPLVGQPVIRGTPVEARTWICAPKSGSGDGLLRYLVREAEPIFRFEHVDPPAAGACSEVVDVVETGLLAPGKYAYRIRYNVGEDGETLEDEATFVLE